MNNTDWILIDTETTGFHKPIYVVEIGAQRMRGWEPNGPPFHKLLNQNTDIPPEVSRVHGYTREILERDGEPAIDVYKSFADYVGKLPIVAYNLKYDLNDVLIPEWDRLGVSHIGVEGFCALKLTQRLLDPVAAGNHKLQTLRQFYRLPERGAHTAMGDVETVIDLIATVLRPIAEDRGLKTWENIFEFTKEAYYPTRIAFGKFKGRDYRDALNDSEFESWLGWLASSSNERSSLMGAWYISNLTTLKEQQTLNASEQGKAQATNGSNASQATPVKTRSLDIWSDPNIEKLRNSVDMARLRLAELEAVYTNEKSEVDNLQSCLFKLVRDQYKERDDVRLIVQYRQKYLDILLREGEEAALEVDDEYKDEQEKVERDYQEAEEAMDSNVALSSEEQKELKGLWRKLVKLFHPDRFASQPDKREAYEQLTALINNARDEGNIDVLREIADDPDGFILRQGWAGLDFTEDPDIFALERLLTTLEIEIVQIIEMTNTLRDSSNFELLNLVQNKPNMLQEIAEGQRATLIEETKHLKEQADKLRQEIEGLSEGLEPIIG